MVFQGGHKALDCAFHPGVNVVRGKNSSGKTTVMDLLAFSLGAEQIRWKPEALLCTHTVVEVQLNDGIATLRREISKEQQRPMEIFWGEIEDALDAPSHAWQRYPFSRSAKIMSFSQALIEALGMPQAQGDGASNITMHQIMRVLYADQPSVHSPIFRMDKWDSTLTRETIGSYLAGVYDDALYSAQLRVREIDTELSRLIADLKGILTILGQTGNALDLDLPNSRVLDLNNKREELSSELIKIKSGFDIGRKKKLSSVSESLRKELATAKQKASEKFDKLNAIDLELADSRLFINELNRRLSALEESKATRLQLSDVQFQFCPCCLAEVLAVSESEAGCHLCKNSIASAESGDTQILRMKNELNVQLKESQSLLEGRTSLANDFRQEIPLLMEEVHSLEVKYQVENRTASTETERALEDIARQLGAIDEEIKQALKLQRLSEAVANLRIRRNELSEERNMLVDRIEMLGSQQESRKSEVSNHIERSMIRLLRQDLPRQPEFVEAHSADVSFVDNYVLVNGSRNFSESSAVVLRHVFHLALLTSSTELEYMRVPRFMMLDGIDDGGMEKERSHRLQKIIVEECSRYKVDFQIIYATSEINPKFENTDLVVSRFFSPGDRSLDVKRVDSLL